MKVLCVAEKPSIAKSITQILSGGQYTAVSTVHAYFLSQANSLCSVQAETNTSRITTSIITTQTLNSPSHP